MTKPTSRKPGSTRKTRSPIQRKNRKTYPLGKRTSSTSRPRRGVEPAPGAGASQGTEPHPAEKIQKVLADAGLGSRRQLEAWIAAGRVSVNGVPASIGQRITAADDVAVDGRPVDLAPREGCRVLVLNKAPGVICTRHDPEGRPTVFDDLPILRSGRWITVGRLDVQTSGLLLITNDGALAHRLMHPSTGLDREYAVRVRGRLGDAAMTRLRDGVEVDGERLAFSDIAYYDGSGSNHWYHVVLMEGRNREVRRLFEAVGVTVSRLKRVRYGPVVLPSTLRQGQRRELGENDLGTLYALLGLTLRLPARRARREGREASLLLPYPKLGGRGP
jgi:23S rRNA pseudouridine2605 synthase